MHETIHVGDWGRPITYIPKQADYLLASLPRIFVSPSVSMEFALTRSMPSVVPSLHGKTHFEIKQVQKIHSFEMDELGMPAPIHRQTFTNSTPEEIIDWLLIADAERLAMFIMALPNAASFKCEDLVPVVAPHPTSNRKRWLSMNIARTESALAFLQGIKIKDYRVGTCKAFKITRDGDIWTLERARWCAQPFDKETKSAMRYSGILFHRVHSYPVHGLAARLASTAERIVCYSGGLIKERLGKKRLRLVPTMLHKNNKSEWLEMSCKSFATMAGADWDKEYWPIRRALKHACNEDWGTVEIRKSKDNVLICATGDYIDIQQKATKYDMLRSVEVKSFITANAKCQWAFSGKKPHITIKAEIPKRT